MPIAVNSTALLRLMIVGTRPNVLPWFSAGFFSFSPDPRVILYLFVCFICRRDFSALGRVEQEEIALARQAVSLSLPSPIPLSFLLAQQFLPSQLLFLEQQMLTLVLEAGVLPSSSRTA